MAPKADFHGLKSWKVGCHWDRTRRGCLHITPLCNTYRSSPFAVVLFDALATAMGYKAPASVMDCCIHLIQPTQSHFYSPVFEKTTDGSTSPRRGLVAVVTFLLHQRSLILCFRQNAPSLQIADCIAVGGGQCQPLQTRQCVPQFGRVCRPGQTAILDY